MFVAWNTRFCRHEHSGECADISSQIFRCCDWKCDDSFGKAVTICQLVDVWSVYHTSCMFVCTSLQAFVHATTAQDAIEGVTRLERHSSGCNNFSISWLFDLVWQKLQHGDFSRWDDLILMVPLLHYQSCQWTVLMTVDAYSMNKLIVSSEYYVS